jgi:hypothetical protein
MKFSEPIGHKAPSFANDVKSISISREVDSPFELSCRAQGYPSPSFRYKFDFSNFYGSTLIY